MGTRVEFRHRATPTGLAIDLFRHSMYATPISQIPSVGEIPSVAAGTRNVPLRLGHVKPVEKPGGNQL